MLNRIHIRNFKSLQNITLDLQDVNLFIGANNAGKSNFLKALVFFSQWVNNLHFKKEDFKRLVFGHEEIVVSESKNESVNFRFVKQLYNQQYIYDLELYDVFTAYNQFIGLSKEGLDIQNHFKITDIDNILKNFYSFILQIESNHFFAITPFHNAELDGISKSNPNGFTIYKHNPSSSLEKISPRGRGDFFKDITNIIDGYAEDLLDVFSNLKIYQPNPSKFNKPYPTLSKDHAIQEDAANLVSFLDNMRDEFPEVNEAIVKDLHHCIDEFTDLRFQKVEMPEDSEERKLYGDKTFKKFGLYDKFGHTYWAEELSEGTLYFLALLAIIHQPNPPKLLLLEEPEKGIHPRRIKEILKFIFNLSETKGIQVIMTSHNLDVLNFFQEMPEKVFVFDKNQDGATEIKNLYQDIIEPKEKDAEEKGYEMDWTDNLGMRWKAGFFGGVPLNNI
jgi:predicted ATPase